MTNRYERLPCKWQGDDDKVLICCMVCQGYINEDCPFCGNQFGDNVTSSNLYLMSLEEKMLDIRTRSCLNG